VLRIRDPRSGAFLIPGPGSGIRIGFFWISDPGSSIPDPKPIFFEFSDKFLGKKFYNSLKTGPNFFLQHFKNLATKKGMTTNIFSPLSFVEVFGSGIRDPGWVKNQDSGSGINIPDPHASLIKTY
jgi:hypothetical protein